MNPQGCGFGELENPLRKVDALCIGECNIADARASHTLMSGVPLAMKQVLPKAIGINFT